MFSVSRLLIPVVVFAASLAYASNPDLWVCADRNNLPYSNDREQGFENKLAELIAHDLGRKVQYVWWPASAILSHKIFRRGACDVIMGVPAKGYDLAEPTQPYYTSSYVFVTRRGRKVQSFDDPALHRLRIGVHIMDDGFTPAAQELAARGMFKNVVGYSVVGNLAQKNPSAELIRAVARGDIDVAIAWGPQAGYFAARSSDSLEVAPICRSSVRTSVPVTFDIALGVRPGEDALRKQLDTELTLRKSEIHHLLLSYGIPLLEPGSTPGACK